MTVTVKRYMSSKGKFEEVSVPTFCENCGAELTSELRFYKENKYTYIERVAHKHKHEPEEKEVNENSD